MNGDDSPIFVDTNVLVYANLVSAPLHQTALLTLQRYRQQGTELWISRQVTREYLAVVTRPQTFARPLSPSTAVQRIRFFESYFRVADETAGVTMRLAILVETLSIRGKQIHDANIVATMLVHDIGRLLTYNVDDFVRFSPMITVLPLA